MYVPGAFTCVVRGEEVGCEVTIRYDMIRYDTIRYDTIRYDTLARSLAPVFCFSDGPSGGLSSRKEGRVEGRVSSHDDFSAEVENAAILGISRTRPRIFAPGCPSYLNPKLNDANIR